MCGRGLVLVLIAAFTIQMRAQENSHPPSEAPLVLTGAIPLPNVKGRMIILASMLRTTGFLFLRREIIRKRLLASVRRQ